MTSSSALPPRLIYPTPLHCRWGGGMLRLPGYVRLKTSVALEPELGEHFESLWRCFTRETGKLTISAQPEINGHAFVLCDQPKRSPGMPTLPTGMSYALSVSPSGVAAVAKDADSLRQAWHTLMQLIHPARFDEGDERFDLPCVEIADRPAMQWRGAHLCVFPESDLLLIEKALKLLGLLKYSHVVIEFWGMLQLDTLAELAWPQAMKPEQARHLLNTARRFGLEVVPMFNAWGHAAQSRCRYGRHAVLDQNPRMAPLFEPDGWTWCLTNSDAFSIIKNVIGELHEIAGPGGYFHLGCDEAYSHRTCDRCRSQSSPKLLANHINRLTDVVHSHGRQPIIWGDALLDATQWPRPVSATSSPTQMTHLALDELSRDIVIADWQYDLHDGEAGTVSHFVNAGFNVLACPWHNRRNTRTLAETVRKHGAMGMMVTTWDTLRDQMVELCHAGAAAWVDDLNVLDGPAYHSVLRTMASHYSRVLHPAHGRYGDAGWSYQEVGGSLRIGDI